MSEVRYRYPCTPRTLLSRGCDACDPPKPETRSPEPCTVNLQEFIELMTSDRKIEASREGLKRRICGTSKT